MTKRVLIPPAIVQEKMAEAEILSEQRRTELKNQPRRPTFLYRHFDSKGRLLYVGISLSVLMRLNAHAHNSRWFEKIDNVKIERFRSRKMALAAEAEVIRSEKPLYNVMGKAT
jgi:excinuclease UvrABC nuclease subunit